MLRKICTNLWFLVIGFSFLGSASIEAASLTFGGQFRGQYANYYKLDLANEGKSYNALRTLLYPNVVIDDHFRIRSQWSLLASPGGASSAFGTPNANTPLGVGQGGLILGDRSSVNMVLSRAWLEWTSDFGVFRVGRMPVHWGYGMLYDEGLGLWDNFQTTFDRIEYRLHLGYVMGGLAVSEPRRGSVSPGQNDSTFYAIYLEYNNPESQVEAGIMFEKQSRSSDQRDELLNKNLASGSVDRSLELGFAPGTALTPSPKSNNVVDVYMKKTVRYFTFGGEVVWLDGEAFDYNADGTTDKLSSAFGVMGSAEYKYHAINAFLQVMYATGDSNLSDGTLSAFVLLNRNRHPGLILGNELLGASHGNHVGLGSTVAYGNTGSYSGVFFVKPGMRFDWSKSWSTGLEVIVANKASVQAGESKSLGVEVDIGAEYAIYKNAVAALDVGVLVPGAGIAGGNATPYAFRFSLGIDF